MKINGKITLHISRDFTTIELRDDDANTLFATVKLTPQQLNDALSGMGYIPCEIELRGIERVGKKHETISFTMEAPPNFDKYKYHTKGDYSELVDYVQKEVDKKYPGENWVVENYFGSQNSFFIKDSKKFVCATLRRWV